MEAIKTYQSFMYIHVWTYILYTYGPRKKGCLTTKTHDTIGLGQLYIRIYDVLGGRKEGSG